MTKKLQRRRSLELVTPDELYTSVIRQWYSEKADSTQKTYRAALRRFEEFLPEPTQCKTALQEYLHADPSVQYAALADYQTALTELGLSAATVNHLIAPIQSLSHAAARAGLGRHVTVKSRRRPKTHKHGVTTEQWVKLLQHVEGVRWSAKPGTRREKMAIRMLAVLRLLRDGSLRRKEVVTIPAGGVDFARKTLHIYPKGPRGDRTTVPVEGAAWEALWYWLEIRPETPRLFGWTDVSALNKQLASWGAEVGIHVTPHMLRHNGATEALAKGIPLDVVQKHMRHADPRTTQIYDDRNHEAMMREIQRKLGEDGKEDT